jgi:tripartite-type tricarboxylate transporter receptor subunit TctC
MFSEENFHMHGMRIAASFAAIVLCNTVWSQTYPTRPVRIVVGFGSGGPDTTARLVGQQLAVQTGQPFIVDNRPGAGATIAADIVAKAAPDGYTLLVGSNTLTIGPSTYKHLPFDLMRDFAPVSQTVAAQGYILVVNPSLPVRDVKELIALARRPDSRISYGSDGVGSAGHLVTTLFNLRAKTNMVHVPYKGAAALTNALAAGEIQVVFGTATFSLPLIKAGKIRALAYDDDKRAPFLPDVPTMAEAGASPNRMNNWHGLFAPAKTPPAVLARLEAEVRKAIALPEMRERLEKLNYVPVGSSVAQFRQFFADAVKRSAEAAQAAGLEPQ